MKHFVIALTDVRIHAFHGVMDQERKVGNEFKVNMRVEIPYSPSIKNDNIDDTVSYADLYNIVREEMAIPRSLLETVADSIAERIVDKWPQIQSGQITICKSTPPISTMTGEAEVTLFF